MLATTIALLSMIGVMVAALVTTVAFVLTRFERRLDRLEDDVRQLRAEMNTRFDVLAAAIADMRESH